MKWFFSGLGTTIVGFLIGWVLNEKIEIPPNPYKTLHQSYNKFQNSCDELKRNYSESQNKNNELQNSYNELIRNHNELQSTNNTLESEINTIQNHWGILIKSLSVGNKFDTVMWLTNPGDTLRASEIRYLTPQITFDSYTYGKVTLDIKIIKPDGTLVGKDWPRDSHSEAIQIRRGNQMYTFYGWGNKYDSIYKSGTYTVEVWYENKCLISEEVTIY